MKSWFLENVPDLTLAAQALDAELPGQRHPWILSASGDDAIAYFNIDEMLDGQAVPHIVADISGRHYHEDDAVIAVLERLRLRLGGEITNDA